MLSDRQLRFVQEYCKDFIATKAYVRAGYSEQGADQGASRLLSNVEIQIAIEDEKSALAALAGLTRQYLVKNLKDIVDSDRPRACRNCHGIGHEYQWTEREYMRELDRALAAGIAAPDLKGGFGYSKKRAPFDECPACHGDGIVSANLEPTKKADKIKAADLLSKLGGLVIERKELTGPNGGPLQTANTTLDLNALSDEQLAAMLGANALSEGIIEGTLSLPEPNEPVISELEAASSP
jgi:hypothetical protein